MKVISYIPESPDIALGLKGTLDALTGALRNAEDFWQVCCHTFTFSTLDPARSAKFESARH